MTRNGKIARLSDGLREQVNERLRNGEPAGTLLEWLNEQPAVKRMVERYFENAPINPQNLSDWRLGGYVDWLEMQERLEMVGRVKGQARQLEGFTVTTEGICEVLSAELARMTVELLRDCQTTQERWDKLQELLPVVNSLRRGYQGAVWAQIREKEWKLKEAVHDEQQAEKARRLEISRQLWQETAAEIEAAQQKLAREKRAAEAAAAKEQNEQP